MATTVLGLKTFAASDPVDYNEINDNYNKIDNGVKTALQGRAANQLLDNSNFQINQRGQTSWTGWNSYTVDRWIFRNTKVQVASIGTSGMSITTGSSEIYFEQPIEKSVMQRYIGKTLTLVFSTNEGLLIKKWTVVDGSYGRESIGNFQMTIGCMTNGWIDLVVPANKTVNIYWAALYEGSYTADTLPAYVPKGYAAELAECMRYYYRSNDSNSGQDGMIIRRAINISNGTGSYSLESVDLPVPMRITPTITVFDVYGNKNYVQEWYSNDQVGNTSIRYANNRSFCVASESGNFIGGKSYYFNYEASADL